MISRRSELTLCLIATVFLLPYSFFSFGKDKDVEKEKRRKRLKRRHSAIVGVDDHDGGDGAITIAGDR